MGRSKTNEEVWESVEPILKKIEEFLEIMKKNVINDLIPRANTILADLQRRVEVLEQKQTRKRPKRTH